MMTQLAVFSAMLPEIHWIVGDDLCDCTFQRVGEWTNPYLAETLRVRLCCLWKELAKQYPQFIQEIPAFYDSNRHAWKSEPREWDSDEMDMPVYLWYRQLAKEEGLSLDQVRAKYGLRTHERPKRITTEERLERQDSLTEEEKEAGVEARLKASGWLL